MGVGWTNDDFSPSGFRLDVTNIPTVYQMSLNAIGGLLERKKLFSHVEDDDINFDKEVVDPYYDKKKRIKEILMPRSGVDDYDDDEKPRSNIAEKPNSKPYYKEEKIKE